MALTDASAPAPTQYEQLDALALDLLRAAVAASSIAQVARDLDYARPSISQALAGKYPGDTRHLRAVIIEKLQGRHDCPAIAREVAPAECRAYRDRPIPTGPRRAVKAWEACQRCAFNPKEAANV